MLAGSLFIGWYLDEACTVPADFGRIDGDTELYASFAPAAGLLELEAIPVTVGGRVARLLLLSACDAFAVECGFIVENGLELTAVPATRYRSVDGTTAWDSFGADDGTSLLFTCTLPVLPTDAGTLRIIPYWVTPDGSRVYGKASDIRLD